MAGTAALAGALGKEMEGPLPRRYAFFKGKPKVKSTSRTTRPRLHSPSSRRLNLSTQRHVPFGALSSLGATVRVGLQWVKRQEVSMRVDSSAAERRKQWHGERVQKEDMRTRNTQADERICAECLRRPECSLTRVTEGAAKPLKGTPQRRPEHLRGHKQRAPQRFSAVPCRPDVRCVQRFV